MSNVDDATRAKQAATARKQPRKHGKFAEGKVVAPKAPISNDFRNNRQVAKDTPTETDYSKREEQFLKATNRGNSSDLAPTAVSDFEKEYVKAQAFRALEEIENIRLGMRDSYSYHEGSALPSSWSSRDRRKVKEIVASLAEHPELQEQARSIIESTDYKDSEKSAKLGKLLS